MKLFVFVTIAFALCTSPLTAENAVDGFTVPSADIMLSFVVSGKVAKVKVKQGNQVNAGQVLVELDDRVEKNKIAQLEIQYNNESKKQSQVITLEQKKRDLKSLEKATDVGASSRKEIESARLEVKQLEFSILQIDLERELLKKQIEEEKLLHNNTRLTCPIDGEVELVNIEEGETVERLAEVVRVVKVDPLWVEVNIPLSSAHGLNIGDACKIMFSEFNGKKPTYKSGKVIFRSSVADPGSDTLKFRLEVSNPEKRIAGERISVMLGE